MNRLIMFSGPPCSGKTTLAGIVSTKLGIPHLSVDEISKEINPESDYSEKNRNANYTEMHRRARRLLGGGQNSVILDATYARPETYLAFANLAFKLSVQVRVIECMVSPETAVSRWEEREEHPAVDMTKERAYALAKDHQYAASGVVIRTDELPIGVCVDKIMSYLGEQDE